MYELHPGHSVRITVAATLATMLLVAPLLAEALSANGYRKLSKDEQIIYLYGVLDGISTSQLWYRQVKDGEPAPIATCFAKYEPDQLHAVVAKAIEAKPEKWSYPASFFFLAEAERLCGPLTK